MFFLKIKHWQLFLIILAVPILYKLIPFGLVLNKSNSISGFVSFVMILILQKLIILSWLFLAGTKLKEKYLGSNTASLFKSLFLVPLIDIIIALVYLSSSDTFLLFQLFIAFHLCSMLVQLVIISIVAINLKSVEKQTNVSATKCIEEIILIFLFFPIGIWKIQPRINEIFSKDN